MIESKRERKKVIEADDRFGMHMNAALCIYFLSSATAS